MSSSPSTTAAVDYLRCPLCRLKVLPGLEAVCDGRYSKKPHPPLRLSWQWNSFAEYEAMYASEDYHTKMQEEGGQKPYDSIERVLACQRMAIARLNLWECVNGKREGFFFKGSMIDIGAGNMAFVDMARAHNYSGALGIDPHPMRDDCLRGTWEKLSFDSFYFISLWDVFEHLIEPRKCLRHLKKCLTADGMIAIETPEWNGPLHCKEGDDWRHHRPKQHPILYSRDAIEQLYAEEGLETVLFCRPKSGHAGKMTHFLKKEE